MEFFTRSQGAVTMFPDKNNQHPTGYLNPLKLISLSFKAANYNLKKLKWIALVGALLLLGVKMGLALQQGAWNNYARLLQSLR